MNDQYIPVTNTPRSFTLDSLENKHSFTVLVPTEAELDNLGFELFRHKISPITQDTYRAAIITEIFELYDEATAEDYASLLDANWAAQDLYNQQMQDWQLQEDLRLDDMSKDPKLEISQRPRPEYTMSVRDRAKAVTVATEVSENSQKLRDMTVAMQTYPQRQQRGLVRLLLTGWEGIPVVFKRENEIVPEETYAELRAKLGKRAIAELEMKALAFDGLSEHERGNSASPPESSSEPTSSPGLITDPEASGGTSLTGVPVIPEANSSSPSIPTPETASGETTGEPSASTTASDGETSNSGSTPAETPSESPPAS